MRMMVNFVCWKSHLNSQIEGICTKNSSPMPEFWILNYKLIRISGQPRPVFPSIRKVTLMISAADLYKLPKAELHLHLEGAIPLDFLARLINRNSPGALATPENLKAGFQFKNFGEFVRKWMWTVGQFRSETDFSDLVLAVAGNLTRQNIVHAELFFSPFDYPPGGLQAEKITEQVLLGAEKARAETGISLLFFADIVRNHGAETAAARVKRLIPFRSPVLAGIGLGGSETGFPNEGFFPAFETAREAGFRVVAHSGETQGAEYVRSAVTGLNAERIGHGIRCLEDPEVTELVRSRRIPLEVCPTSNVKTGVVARIQDHPIRKLIDAGLIVTLNSDDPSFFDTSLNQEIEILIRDLGFSAGDVLTLLKNNLTASFLPEEKKRSILTLYP